MKKPAVVSLVVLALIASVSANAFADPLTDTPAPSTAGAAPQKPRAKKKAPRKPAQKIPFKVDTAALTTPPSQPPVEVAHAEPAAAPAPVSVGAGGSQPGSSSAARDEAPSSPRTSLDSEAKPIALAPLVGYASHHLNLGFGARASYTFSNHIAVAGTFVYHLGTSEDVASVRGATASSSVHVFYPGVEGGYDFHYEGATIRPYLGVAAVFVSASQTFDDRESSDTNSHFAIYPGVTGNYEIPGTSMFAGADMRLLIVTDGGDPSFGFFGTFGVRL